MGLTESPFPLLAPNTHTQTESWPTALCGGGIYVCICSDEQYEHQRLPLLSRRCMLAYGGRMRDVQYDCRRAAGRNSVCPSLPSATMIIPPTTTQRHAQPALREVWDYPQTHDGSSSSPMAQFFTNGCCNPGAREKVYLRTRRATVHFMMLVARMRPTQLTAPVPKGAEDPR